MKVSRNLIFYEAYNHTMFIMHQAQYKRSKTQGVEDMVLLPKINDADICDNLKRRFEEDQIFVSFKKC